METFTKTDWRSIRALLWRVLLFAPLVWPLGLAWLVLLLAALVSVPFFALTQFILGEYLWCVVAASSWLVYLRYFPRLWQWTWAGREYSAL